MTDTLKQDLTSYLVQHLDAGRQLDDDAIYLSVCRVCSLQACFKLCRYYPVRRQIAKLSDDMTENDFGAGVLNAFYDAVG